MRTRQWTGELAALVVLLTVPLWGHAEPDEPPAAGRPEDFSGIVGTYEIAARASPTDLRAEDPLTLTIKIAETSGKVPRRFAPQRSALRVFPRSLTRDFYVEAMPDLQQPDPHTWEFAYRLKPKHAGVQKIPALKLSYFDPQYGRYQVAYSRSIPLHVKPRTPVQVAAEGQGVRAPDRVYELATGPAVLRREEPALAPSFLILALLVFAPPAGCAGWYVVWRRLHPDAAGRARWQRSQAARHALHQLHALRKDENGAATAAVVADYLHRRLDLAVAEPTPAEALAHLRRANVSAPVAAKVVDFFRTWDALRFAPEAVEDRRQFAAAAENIILAVEAEPCLSRPS